MNCKKWSKKCSTNTHIKWCNQIGVESTHARMHTRSKDRRFFTCQCLSMTQILESIRWHMCNRIIQHCVIAISYYQQSHACSAVNCILVQSFALRYIPLASWKRATKEIPAIHVLKWLKQLNALFFEWQQLQQQQNSAHDIYQTHGYCTCMCASVNNESMAWRRMKR